MVWLQVMRTNLDQERGVGFVFFVFKTKLVLESPIESKNNQQVIKEYSKICLIFLSVRSIITDFAKIVRTQRL